jgi:hypothetical protein
MAEEYTSAQNYQDEEGSMRTFSFIDHSPKVSVSPSISPEEIHKAKEDLKEFRKRVVETLLSFSASLCPSQDSHIFTLRGEGMDKVEWNVEALEDENLDLWKLNSIKTMVEKKAEYYNKLGK